MKSLKSLSLFLFVLAALAATFIVSCQKEKTNEPLETVTGLDPNAVYYMASDGSLQQIDLDGLGNNPGVTDRTGNAHVNAHYSYQTNSRSHGFYKSHTIQLNATENNQGVNGVGHVWRTWGANGEFSQHIILDADCIDSNGEEAVFTGLVTEVIGDSPRPGGAPFPPVGYRMWLRVKDNGQGANAPLDQYNPMTIISGSIPCEVFGLNSIIWTFLQYENVANESDNINVN